MTQATETKVEETAAFRWSQHLQRRVLRLLLQHDTPLFRNQFRLFFVQSTLPQIPVLQQYDRYMKLHLLSGELLDDILPRIRRQLSLKTSHARLHEEAPTRGEIDWPRTTERNWHLAPGLPALRFETRLRQRSLETPQNLLTIAILLAYRQELHYAMQDSFEDEDLSTQEREVFASADAQAERELAAPYARALTEQARTVNMSVLIQQVAASLRPGPSPYRDLLVWWQRFTQFRIGRAAEEQALTLASKRIDEKTDAWLYELWIVLEWIHLLSQEGSLQTQDMNVDTDLLQCTFTWQGRRFRLLYNRQLDTSTSYQSDWQHGPTSRPDYTIEREIPLEIRHEETLTWREPPFVLDAKYYLGGSDPTRTHGPIKKLLGDMTLLGAQVGTLFFPELPEPEGEQSITRTIQRRDEHYSPMQHTSPQIHLYHLEPTLSLTLIQNRLRSILDIATRHLPDRPLPICQGTWLDPDTVNASHSTLPAQTILCPKPHVGPGAFDLVNVNTDCLKNPRLCHVIGQPIVPPFIVRVTTQEQLTHQASELRVRSDELLRQAEQVGDEARAERIRDSIFTGIGRAVEQYVKLFGSPKAIEENFERWVFGPHWKQHRRCLSETARNALVSGEQVWQNYHETPLHDWAAPAIQYCRALEIELKRRLYAPSYKYVLNNAGFTLGTITFAYKNRDRDVKAKANWNVFLECVAQSGSSIDEFQQIVQWMDTAALKEKRNMLAHGEAITRELATSLRESVIGDRSRPGMLCWLVEHVEPVRSKS